jgi:hypothetical protein
MKRNRLVPLFALTLGIGAALSPAAIAFGQESSSAIGAYSQSARTLEDHQHAASLFEQRAAKAQSLADQYSDRFGCIQAKSTELQREGSRFPVTEAQRYCIKMSRHYVTIAKESRELAERHHNAAAQLASINR